MQDLKSEPKASNLQGIVILRKRVIRILDKSYNNAHTEHQLAHDQISRHSFVTRSVYGRVFTMPIVLLTLLKVYCLQTLLSDSTKVIGAFSSKIIFHLNNLRRAHPIMAGDADEPRVHGPLLLITVFMHSVLVQWRNSLC